MLFGIEQIDDNGAKSFVVDSYGTTLFFDTGAGAAETLLILKNIEAGRKLRVKLLPNELYPAGHECSEVDDSWHEREQLRFDNGEYIEVPWACEIWWSKLDHTPVPANDCAGPHFAHVSAADPTKIAFTASAEHGRLDRQTRISPAKYLIRYLKAMSNDRAAHWAGIMGASVHKVKYTTDSDDVERVYTNGPNSCMSKPVSKYRSSVHPTRAYGGGDLSIAYLVDSSDDSHIVARTVVYRQKRKYARIFGDSSRLLPLLEALGYSSACDRDFEGARVRRIMDGDIPVLPYFDVGCGVAGTEDPLFFRVTVDPCHYADGQWGYPNACGTFCFCCEENGFDQDDMCTIEEEFYCSDCYYSNGNRCDNCGDSFLEENVHTIYPEEEALVCTGCLNNSSYYFECHECEHVFSTDNRAGETSDGNSICTSCSDNYVWLENKEEYVLLELAFCCVRCETDCHNDDASGTTAQGETFCNDCSKAFVIPFDATEYVLKSDAYYCASCDEHYMDGECEKCQSLAI